MKKLLAIILLILGIISIIIVFNHEEFKSSVDSFLNDKPEPNFKGVPREIHPTQDILYWTDEKGVKHFSDKTPQKANNVKKIKAKKLSRFEKIKKRCVELYQTVHEKVTNIIASKNKEQ